MNPAIFGLRFARITVGVTLGATVGVTLGALGLASQARAAAPPPALLEHRGYVYAAPGGVSVPIGDEDFDDLVGPSYRWGLGVGGVFAFSRYAGGMAGFRFDHSPLAIDDDVNAACRFGALGSCTLRAHQIVLSPELRLGGGTGPFFGYGLVAPGLGLMRSRLAWEVLGTRDDRTDLDLGFQLVVGGGALFTVWRGFTVGAETGATLGFFHEDDMDDLEVGPQGSGYQAHSIDFRGVLGWVF